MRCQYLLGFPFGHCRRAHGSPAGAA